MTIIDGKQVAAEIRQDVKEKVKDMKTKPKLVVVLVGDDQASKVYVGMKEKDAEEVGMEGSVIRKPADITQEELDKIINELNQDATVHGILLQLPIPDHLDANRTLDLIDPDKDVDGLHDVNVGRLHNKKEGLRPCTPSGIMKLLDYYDIELSGKNAVVIGRSNLVGKPIARMLEQANATVTLCHSRTKNLDEITRKADIIIMAAGRPEMLTAEMVTEGVVVIDVGINRVNGKLVGDVDFDQVVKKADKITPVPGGVGPMTRAMLLVNTLKAKEKQNN